MKKSKAHQVGGTPSISKYQAAGSGSSGSRFSPCPVCGRSVPIATMSFHLDTACQPAPSDSPGAVAAAGPAPLPPVLQEAAAAAEEEEEPIAAGSPGRHPGKELVGEGPPDNPPQSAQPAGGQQRSDGTGGGAGASSSGAGGSSWGAAAQKKAASAAAVATAHRDLGQTQQLTPGQLFGVAYAELIPDFLPGELADQVMRHLKADDGHFKHVSWWIGGKEGKTSKASLQYAFPPPGTQLELREDSGGGLAGAPASAGTADADADASGEVLAEELPAPPALQLAADMVAAAVNERIAGGGAAHLPLEAADRGGAWAPSYVLANRYRDGSEVVGKHSDRLTTLGPLPIIASLTLGATREFRLSRTQVLEFQCSGGSSSCGGGVPSSSSRGASPSSRAGVQPEAPPWAAEVSRVDVPLPHNTLLIMWPPCQEVWKHEIPSTSKPFPLHAGSSVRYNLTFRRTKREWMARAPQCQCWRPAIMKAGKAKPPPKAKARAAGQQEGGSVLRYVYACDSTGRSTKPCGFFKQGPEIQL